MDNAKVMEKLEQTAIFTFFEKMIKSDMRRLLLFPIFPYTAAANLSDPRPFIMFNDLRVMANLNSGAFWN